MYHHLKLKIYNLEVADNTLWKYMETLLLTKKLSCGNFCWHWWHQIWTSHISFWYFLFKKQTIMYLVLVAWPLGDQLSWHPATVACRHGNPQTDSTQETWIGSNSRRRNDRTRPLLTRWTPDRMPTVFNTSRLRQNEHQCINNILHCSVNIHYLWLIYSSLSIWICQKLLKQNLEQQSYHRNSWIMTTFKTKLHSLKS